MIDAILINAIKNAANRVARIENDFVTSTEKLLSRALLEVVNNLHFALVDYQTHKDNPTLTNAYENYELAKKLVE